MKAVYQGGRVVRVSGIYVRADGSAKDPQRTALAIGERFPPVAGGWNLEKRISVQRPALEPAVPRQETRPIVLDAGAMEYALERVHRGGWNGALRTLEARILSNGAAKKSAHVLALIEELRIRRTMPGSDDEGDLTDG